MGKESRATPRTVCVALPIMRAAGRILLVTSRKRAGTWVLPKGGYEDMDKSLEAAASREALEEAGVHGQITRFITSITNPKATAKYYFFELDVSKLDEQWLESSERIREWVDYNEAIRRVMWKPELAQALQMSSLAPKR